METICVRAKIKKGHLEGVRQWFQTLKDRKDEVLQTLENEKAFVESVFLDKQGDNHYLIYYMKVESLSHTFEAHKNSTLPIDLYHRECWKRFCEEKTTLEVLADFDRIKS